ncbi:MAG: trypsin-like serine peptidase, partial [Acidobacteriota bacterium]
MRAAPQRLLPQSQLPAKVVLDPVPAARLNMEATAQPSKPGVPLRIGFSRDVPMLRNTAQTSALLLWTSVPGAQVAAISITSPEALGVRLGLLIERLPATALLRFYAQGADQVFEVSGEEIMATIARNLAAGENGEEARTYWAPVIDGQEVTMEIELPAGVSPDDVMFSIPRVSHLFSSPLDTRALQEKIGQSGACNLDSVCYAAWGNESLATAKMLFSSGGSSFICTGTLMDDQDPSTFIPFFLTANHCISTQASASSLQTYWFYRASSCNSGTLSPSMQTLTGGATLLYASSVTDTSFMRLNSAVPGGVWMSAWTASQPAISSPDIGIHNPSGDLQKISFGTITGITGWSGPGTSHLQVVWSQGVTEGGSSGSGLWITSGGGHYLVGQLHGGLSSCSLPAGADYYGRFDVAYNAALYQWLGAPVAAPARFIATAPCRLVDTRSPGGYPISGGQMAAGESRSFALPSAACGIPSNAVAYALNATVVPSGPLGWLTLWPAGSGQPTVSTLNAPDGRTKANAAIVPAGIGGAVSAYVTDAS